MNKLNNYVVNTKDYNKRVTNGKGLEYHWKEKAVVPLDCFYDFAAEKPVSIGEFRLDKKNLSPFHMMMNKLCENL